jgi:hypothetical protein
MHPFPVQLPVRVSLERISVKVKSGRRAAGADITAIGQWQEVAEAGPASKPFVCQQFRAPVAGYRKASKL